MSHHQPEASARASAPVDRDLRMSQIQPRWSCGQVCAAILFVMSVGLCIGCGQGANPATADTNSPTVTLGNGAPAQLPVAPKTERPAEPLPEKQSESHESEVPAKPRVADNLGSAETSSAQNSVAAVTPENTSGESASVVSETRTFKMEGPEQALRVSYDDLDLLKVMNLDPVPSDAPERMPAWLKALDGKRLRVRGFMFPPFQDKDIRGFVLARDNQICCFGRTPKEYDLIDIFMRKGVTTHYIQNRPFDVVGVFRIKTEIEKYTAMYELEDAVVMEK